MIPLDLRDFARVKQVLQTVQPNAVIHAAAQARPHICQMEPQSTFAINVEASWSLAGLCADQQIPLVFVSTDLVFDGHRPPYTESSAVSPVNHYGEQKVAAEQGMRQRYPQVVVARMPLMFGCVPYADSFIQALMQNLRSHHPLQLFEDEFRTPVSGMDAAYGLLLALEQGKVCLHLGGPERLSRYEMGQQLADVLGCSNTLLAGCSQKDVSLATPRPADVSLDSSLAFSLGYAPQSFLSGLKRLFANP